MGVGLIRQAPDGGEEKGFHPMRVSALDSSLFGLGWRGRFDAERGLSHTVEILRQLVREEDEHG